MALSSTTARVPLSRRINFRVLAFVGVVAVLLGYPIYLAVDSLVTGGVTQVGNYKEVNLKALGQFPFDGRLEDIPAKWRALDGQKVLLEGEVYAPNEAGDRMTQFQLVYSIQKCCFGGPPLVQERVFAVVPPTMKQPNLSMGRAKVYGTLRVTVERDDTTVVSLYKLDVEKIEPVS